MTYVGAFVYHANDAELCLVIEKRQEDRRLRLRRWANGVVRTAKEDDVFTIPIPKAIELIRTLILSEVPAKHHDALGGKADLVAAAYAFTTTLMAQQASLAVGVKNAPGGIPIMPRLVKQAHSSTKTPSHKEDFLREAVIAEVLVANLSFERPGTIKVLGTKRDLVRLIEIYCATAGISAPKQSTTLRRFEHITSFLAQEGAELMDDAVYAQCGVYKSLLIDTQEMEQ